MQQQSAIVIGAGIVGLACARALAEKGFSVTVFDRNVQASGASVRNFGMIWPIGQPSGKLYNRAIRSREIWKEVAAATNMWCNQSGSLHLAYSAEEWQVLQELEIIFKNENRGVELLDVTAIANQFEHIIQTNLFGGLFSKEEMLIDPREAMQMLPIYLEKKYDVKFFWNTCVSKITNQTVCIEKEQTFYNADIIFVCSGVDFETLYPAAFAQLPLTKCKLQMMRTENVLEKLNIKTAVCGGLSLLHYNSFKAAPSLPILKNKMEAEMKPYLDLGIHVMAAQNDYGEITIGDSHQYGLHTDPFDKTYINKMVLDYLQTFLPVSENNIAETWHGFYSKLTNGDAEIFISPEKGVYILNGLGGAGMTLSLGLAEELINEIV